MKSCLLCGAASWGPADPAVTQSFQAMHTPPEGTPTEYRMCDNCGVLAREDLINVSAPGPLSMDAPFQPPFQLIGGPNPPADPFVSGLQLMKGLMPERAPETRLERIVREVIRSDNLIDFVLMDKGGAENLAQALVDYARAIEKAMDQETRPTPATSRNFQQDFVSPVLSLILPGSEIAVGLAMDCAIVFGALEAREKGDSFGSVAMLEQTYAAKVERLKFMVRA
jgi:hypothetical protein